jgi:hypothetical protein
MISDRSIELCGLQKMMEDRIGLYMEIMAARIVFY